MKHGMPRKIDDERRRRLVTVCVLLTVSALAAWIGYDAWMRTYRERRDRLAGEVREGRAFWERSRTQLGTGGMDGLVATKGRLTAIAASGNDLLAKFPTFSPASTAVRSNATPLSRDYAAAVAEYGEAQKAIRATVRKASALGAAIDGLQDLEDALVALESLGNAARPSAAAAELAEMFFYEAYGKAMEAVNQFAQWEQGETGAEAISGEMAAAERRLKAAANRIRSVNKEMKRNPGEGARAEGARK